MATFLLADALGLAVLAHRALDVPMATSLPLLEAKRSILYVPLKPFVPVSATFLVSGVVAGCLRSRGRAGGAERYGADGQGRQRGHADSVHGDLPCRGRGRLTSDFTALPSGRCTKSRCIDAPTWPR